MQVPIPPPIQAAMDAVPTAQREILMALRRMILETATGDIEETLKWGQPSYRATGSNKGTPIRIGLNKSGSTALFTHCQTSVISDFRALFPDEFSYEGNRALIVEDTSKSALLRSFIKSALTYSKG